MQLRTAHIHAHHRPGSGLQQAIGKASGRLTHIQTGKTFHGQTHLLERGFQLEPAARHIARLGVIEQPHLGRFRHLVAILGNAPPGLALRPFDAIGNEPLRLGTGVGKPPLNQQLIYSHCFTCVTPRAFCRRLGVYQYL